MGEQVCRVTYPEQCSDEAPLVVLMGWIGAQHKNLAKYTALMLELGCVCVQVIQPAAVMFSPVEGPQRQYAAKVLAFLQGKDLAKDRWVLKDRMLVCLPSCLHNA